MHPWQLFASVSLISFFTIMYSEKLTFISQSIQFKVLLWGTPSLRSGMCICFLSVSGGVCISWISFLYLEECVCVNGFAVQWLPKQTLLRHVYWSCTAWLADKEIVNWSFAWKTGVEVVYSSRGKTHIVLLLVSAYLPFGLSFSGHSFHWFTALQ